MNCQPKSEMPYPEVTLGLCCLRLPKFFAVSVTLRPKGSRQSWRMGKPGWGGFFIGIGDSSSRAVDQVDTACVFALNVWMRRCVISDSFFARGDAPQRESPSWHV